MKNSDFDAGTLKQAIQHLKKSDPVLKNLIHRVGPFKLQLRKGRYRMLVYSIISQQLSTSAAHSIHRKLEILVKPGPITPHKIQIMSEKQLNSAGISRQKTLYLKNLTEHTLNGKLPFNRMSQLSDEQIIEKLTQVKGIGVWTAQMLLMFSMGRLDIFPYDDLGIKKAMKELYHFDKIPTKMESQQIAAPWKPYRSIASWYLWRQLDSTKK